MRGVLKMSGIPGNGHIQITLVKLIYSFFPEIDPKHISEILDLIKGNYITKDT